MSSYSSGEYRVVVMNVERASRIDQLFEAALDLPAGERRSWLVAECAQDPTLVVDVERLLSNVEREIDDLLLPVQSYVTNLEAESGAELAAGETLGGYTILQPIGRGGMGAVYLAERSDGSFERRVAIKVMPAAVRSPEAVRRFEHERRILARVDQPRIARLLDGGVDGRGLPFIVLEHVEGEAIDQHCDRRRAAVEERLRLVIEVARAVQSAHQSLVVHRDLKPANVLVTPAGEVKLLDFGIAKLVDDETIDAGLTVTGGRPMTPTYASPEQVSSEPITTSTDIYQLGLLLYELLTGLRPQAGQTSSLAELVELVCQREPVPPSRAALAAGPGGSAAERAERRGSTPAKLARRYAGDLDAIVGHALAKRPSERYATMAELADDLERYLEGRPITARRTTILRRGVKWVRRNRALAAATGLAVSAILGYAVTVTLQARAIERQRVRAQTEAVKAAEVERFLVSLFESNEPGQARGRTITAAELLDRGLARVDRDLAGQPEVQARVWSTLGRIEGNLGNQVRARELLERALERQLALLGDSHLEVGETRERLGGVLRRQGNPTGAVEQLEQALAIYRAGHPPDSLPIARVLGALGTAERNRNRSDRALALTRESLEIYRRLGDERGIVDALTGLGGVQVTRGDFAGADTYYREALERAVRVYAERHPHVALLQIELGWTLVRRDRYDEAIALLEAGLATDLVLYGEDHMAVAEDQLRLAVACQRLGQLERADGLYATALPKLLAQVDPGSSAVALARLGLGELRYLQGRYPEAERELELSLRSYLDLLKTGNRAHAQVRLWLGRVYRAQGRREEALAVWKVALAELNPGVDETTRKALERELSGAGGDGSTARSG